MKKLTNLVLGTVIALGLAACGGGGEETPTISEADAIASVKSSSALIIRGSNSNPLSTVRNNTLEADENEYLFATTMMEVEDKLVTVEWAAKVESAYSKYYKIAAITDDPTHVKVTFTYPDKGAENTTFVFRGTFTCGEVTDTADYNLSLAPTTKETKLQKISEVKKVSSGTIKTRGYITGFYNHIYEEVYRGIIISDGADSAMLYAGQCQKLFYDTATSEMNFNYGDLIEIEGTVSPYSGLWEVKPTMIAKVEDDTIAAPTVTKMSAAEIAAINTSEGIVQSSCNQIECTDTLSIVSVKCDSKDATLDTLITGKHWVFTVKGGESTFNISVNYHVGSAIQTKVQNFLKANATFKFKGFGGGGTAPVNELTAMETTAGDASLCFIAA